MSEEANRVNQQAERDLKNYTPEATAQAKIKKRTVSQMIDNQNYSLNQKDEEVDLKPALAMIKEATGLSDFKEILQKMERHSETISSLTQLQKTLQVKLMNLFSKRDNLTAQISGADSELQLEDFDALEREVSQIQLKCDQLKAQKEKERRLGAEVSNGVQMLCIRVGVSPSGNMVSDIEQCMQSLALMGKTPSEPYSKQSSRVSQ